MREVRRKAQLAARRSLVVLLARSEAIRTNRRCKEGLAHASVTDLVSTYAQAAAVHGRASSEGDYETANIQHDLIAAVYRQLRERGPGAQAALLDLADAPDPFVRSWAGAHALEFSPSQGEEVLAGVAAEGGLAGFDAEMTLKTWGEGQLRFP
jgi:Domain of unknown function (DUF2019)